MPAIVAGTGRHRIWKTFSVVTARVAVGMIRWRTCIDLGILRSHRWFLACDNDTPTLMPPTISKKYIVVSFTPFTFQWSNNLSVKSRATMSCLSLLFGKKTKKNPKKKRKSSKHDHLRDDDDDDDYDYDGKKRLLASRNSSSRVNAQKSGWVLKMNRL